MITRAEYMADSERLHQAYYLEIALEAPIMLTLPFGIRTIIAAFQEGDPHLNTLSLPQWDNYSVRQQHYMRQPLKRRNDSYSLGTGVCILKALARHRAAEYIKHHHQP